MKKFDHSSPIVDIENYLKEHSLLEADEHITAITKPGEGNMNVVMRISTSKKSFILKQSRPFVQKYQQIAAPLNRIEVECHFYEVLSGAKIGDHLPKIIKYIPADYTLILEDLGDCDDMTYLYASRIIDEAHLRALVAILSTIHQQDVGLDYPENIEMRRLNHQHIFELPFMIDNGFHLDDIQPGLQAVSIPYKEDEALKEIITTIGQAYLSKGNILLHGDFYPGSWMSKGNEIYIIDPEFSFAGFAEYDLGVLSAHCIMASMNTECIETILNSYEGDATKKLVHQIAGIEIMRRLIGLAQLPLERTIIEKEYLLQTAYQMIVS